MLPLPLIFNYNCKKKKGERESVQHFLFGVQKCTKSVHKIMMSVFAPDSRMVWLEAWTSTVE